MGFVEIENTLNLFVNQFFFLLIKTRVFILILYMYQEGGKDTFYSHYILNDSGKY